MSQTGAAARWSAIMDEQEAFGLGTRDVAAKHGVNPNTIPSRPTARGASTCRARPSCMGSSAPCCQGTSNVASQETSWWSIHRQRQNACFHQRQNACVQGRQFSVDQRVRIG